MSLEAEIALIRSQLAWDGDREVYYVPATSLVYNYGISEIDGVKIDLHPSEPQMFVG